MTRVSNLHSNFVISRKEIELEFEEIMNDTLACNKCKNLFYCRRAEFYEFEK